MVRDLIARAHGVVPRGLRLVRQPLGGGLEAAGVERLEAHYRGRGGVPQVSTMVAKQLIGAAAREAAVYEELVVPHAPTFAPRLLAVDRRGPSEVVVYMEALHPTSPWPWHDRRAAQHVLEQVAQFHANGPRGEAVAAVMGWDYEAELLHTAGLTLGALEAVRRQPGLWCFGGAIQWTRRLVDALASLRQQLLAFAPFGCAVIHGDLHPGNVVIHDRADADGPVLIDWGRARIGSPLEDVSCWLQSLVAWEPEARRRHDTLLLGYLAARGMAPRLDSNLRAAYWLAGASNALAGALLYHLSVLLDATRPDEARARAMYAAREWVRVLRRADAYWR